MIRNWASTNSVCPSGATNTFTPCSSTVGVIASSHNCSGVTPSGQLQPTDGNRRGSSRPLFQTCVFPRWTSMREWIHNSRWDRLEMGTTPSKAAHSVHIVQESANRFSLVQLTPNSVRTTLATSSCSLPSPGGTSWMTPFFILPDVRGWGAVRISDERQHPVTSLNSQCSDLVAMYSHPAQADITC